MTTILTSGAKTCFPACQVQVTSCHHQVTKCTLPSSSSPLRSHDRWRSNHLSRSFRPRTIHLLKEGKVKNLQGFRERAQVKRTGVKVQASQRADFESVLTTNIPLRERYGVPFEEYITDRDRVFEAFFPDKQRSERLSKDEWRIYMLPLNFFFLSVRPVVDMRLAVSNPVSPIGTKVLSLRATRYELRGVDVRPSDFLLSIDGALYAEKRGLNTRLRGRMALRVELAMPAALMLVPPATVETVGSALLHQLLENMKGRVNSRVLEDYASYAWERAHAGKEPAK